MTALETIGWFSQSALSGRPALFSSSIIFLSHSRSIHPIPSTAHSRPGSFKSGPPLPLCSCPLIVHYNRPFLVSTLSRFESIVDENVKVTNTLDNVAAQETPLSKDRADGSEEDALEMDKWMELRVIFSRIYSVAPVHLVLTLGFPCTQEHMGMILLTCTLGKVLGVKCDDGSKKEELRCGAAKSQFSIFLVVNGSV